MAGAARPDLHRRDPLPDHLLRIDHRIDVPLDHGDPECIFQRPDGPEDQARLPRPGGGHQVQHEDAMPPQLRPDIARLLPVFGQDLLLHFDQPYFHHHLSLLLRQVNMFMVVMPELIRHPVLSWIPAFAGIT